MRIHSLGIEFRHYGDTVIWTWPWKRRRGLPWISIGFTGTGEWGDARFPSLRAIRCQWDEFESALRSKLRRDR